MHRFSVRLVGFLKRGILVDDNARVAQQLLEQRVHSLETVRVARIIAEQHVVFEKIGVVFSTVQKNEAVLEQIVERREFFAKEGFARFGDDVFLDVDPALRHLLADGADDATTGRLQFREARLDDVRLLTAFKMFTALANPFLALMDEVRELAAEFRGEEFQNGHAEQQIHLNIFVILGVGQRAMENVSQ